MLAILDQYTIASTAWLRLRGTVGVLGLSAGASLNDPLRTAESLRQFSDDLFNRQRVNPNRPGARFSKNLRKNLGKT